MATVKSSKRSYSDSDSDDEISPSSFPHFIVLETLEEKQLAKLNSIVIEKTILGIVKPKSVKKLNDGNLLIEVDKKAYADNLLKIFFWKPQNQSFCQQLSQHFQWCSSVFRDISLHFRCNENLFSMSGRFRRQTYQH